MGTKLYVGSVSFETTEDQLHQIFTAAGRVVSAKLIKDPYNGQSKGFGFVEMSSEAEAQQAIQMLNGSSVGPRKIVVSEARPMEPRGQSRGFDRGRKGSFKRW